MIDSRVTNNLPEILTPEEVMAALKISKATFYRLKNRRAMPFVRVGRSLRFYKSDILAFLEENRSESINKRN